MVLASSALALVTTYVLSRATSLGRGLDRAASGDRLTSAGSPLAHEAAATLLETINTVSLAAVAALIIGIAFARRGSRAGGVIAGAVLGACVSAETLKAALGRLDPLGGETLRGHPGSFPSGHVTVALVVALAAFAVCSPSRRTPVGLLGGIFATSVGVAVVLLRWHLPSDVLGVALLAACWMAAAGYLLSRRNIVDGARAGGASTVAAKSHDRERLRRCRRGAGP